MNISFYQNGKYLQNNPDWHIADSAWKLSHALKALQHTPSTDFNRLLDAGCGAGEVIKLWAGEEPSKIFKGWEISPQAYEMCLQNPLPNVSFCQERPSENFDIVLILDVLEHLEDWKTFLKDCSRQAKKIIIHIPLDLSLYARLRPSILENERLTVGHIHFFTEKSFLKEIKQMGFEILHKHYTNKYLEKEPPLTRWISKIGMLIRKTAHLLLPTKWTAYLIGGYSLMLVIRPKSEELSL